MTTDEFGHRGWRDLQPAEVIDPDRAHWGLPALLWPYDNVLSDLHGGKGTTWHNDPKGRGYYPDCACHLPKSIADERARSRT